MNNNIRLLLPAIFLTIALVLPAAAQVRSEQTDSVISAATRAEVIDSIFKKLKDSYIFPEIASEMETAIRARMRKGEYNRITSSRTYARTLTAQLREVSHDRHLGVNYHYEPLPVESQEQEPTPEQREKMRRFAVSVNFGFEKIDRLDGNIGYLRIDGFLPAEVGAETATAAMNYLANTDALIFDLRNNHGGDPSMIAFLASYLFGSAPVHLNDLYWREGNRTDQFWTLAFVSGRRYVEKPVYILTSRRTFSAGEEFAYDLQSLKRAVVIGETTGGGANPGGEVRINEHFSVFVPTGRAINPVTKTNWEGTGVKPNIAIPEAQALKKAQQEILKNLSKTTTDEKFK